MAENKENNNSNGLQESEFEDFLIINDPTDFIDLELSLTDKCQESTLMIPEEQVLRPYFFMRLIEKTIHEGGFLTEGIYVPRRVW